jgi:hypothetical protein
MKLGVIIPDRGDRPKFLDNCYRMMAAQSLQPTWFFLSNEPATDNHVDITKRYRVGYDFFRGKGYDLLAFIENDDWYSPDYFATMIAAWEYYGKPDLFGTCYTYYYHIQLKAYFKMEHHTRSSAMNILIKPDMNFPWPVDMEPFLDLHLYTLRDNPIKNRQVFMPDKIISVGMKHGVGKTIEGGSHVIDDRVRRRYVTPDVNPDFPDGFLKTVLDPQSFEFYSNYFN